MPTLQPKFHAIQVFLDIYNPIPPAPIHVDLHSTLESSDSYLTYTEEIVQPGEIPIAPLYIPYPMVTFDHGFIGP